MSILEPSYDDWCDAEEDRKSRLYYQHLGMHPHCGDPEHPGCQFCNPDLADDE